MASTEPTVASYLRAAARQVMLIGPSYEMLHREGLPCILGFVGHVRPDRLEWLKDLLKHEFAEYEKAIHAEHAKLDAALTNAPPS